MGNKKILSASRRSSRSPAAAQGAAWLEGVCQAGVVARALVCVVAALAAGLLFGQHDVFNWLLDVARAVSVALPAVLLWFLLLCLCKRRLLALALAWQWLLCLLLGGLAGVFAVFLLSWFQPVLPLTQVAAAWTAAMLAASVLLGLAWRVRAQHPAATTARLQELQARIRPHFLFNTLNSAIALVRIEPGKAEEVLADLADLFHHALKDQAGVSSVASEIDLTRRYLDIEQVRFGARLRLQWSLDGRASQASLPPLILQPLVENAIVHGVEPSADGADIRVATRVLAGMVHIDISNSTPAGAGRPGQGLALENVRHRLRLLHDLQGDLKTSWHDGVFRARIRVPLIPVPEQRA